MPAIVSLVKDTDDPFYPVQVREDCPKGCGSQIVIDGHSCPGFGAGYVDFFDLACGHQVTEDNSYAER